MKKILGCLILVLIMNQCEARSFGCFAGVLGASNSHDVEIDYNHYQILYNKKTTLDFIPFLGCGISFDF